MKTVIFFVAMMSIHVPAAFSECKVMADIKCTEVQVEKIIKKEGLSCIAGTTLYERVAFKKCPSGHAKLKGSLFQRSDIATDGLGICNYEFKDDESCKTDECDILKKEIGELEKKQNYCSKDEDCIAFSAPSASLYCYRYANRKADQAEYRKLMGAFVSQCNRLKLDCSSASSMINCRDGECIGRRP